MSTRLISVPEGGAGSPLTDQMMSWNIAQLAGRFTEEVMVIVGVGIEIRATGFDDRLAQQPDLGELVKGVIDGRERHSNARRQRFAVKLLGGDVTVPALQKEPRQRQALTRRAQADRRAGTSTRSGR